MEEDASCRVEEEQEEDAVWLRELGHCKMSSVQESSASGFPPLAAAAREAARDDGETQE